MFYRLFLILAFAQSAQPKKMYLDFPEGTSLILFSSPNPSPLDAENDHLRVNIDRRGVFTPRSEKSFLGKKITENGKADAKYLFGDYEWYDDKGRKHVTKNVYVEEADLRANPIIGKEIAVAGVNQTQNNPNADCPPGSSNKEDLKKTADAMFEGTNRNNSLKQAMAYWKVGECLPVPQNQRENFFAASVMKKCQQIDEKANPVVATHNGKKVFSSDLCAIDAMARTIYGEMRSCVRKGNRYPMAIARIIYNRAKQIQQHGIKDTFINPRAASLQRPDLSVREQMKGTHHRMIIPHLFESPQQFSIWNHGDPNNKVVLCPMEGRSQAESSNEWKISLDIATAAVMEDKNFLSATSGVRVTHYTSGIEPRWKGRQEVQSVRVGGMPVDDKSCIRFWKFLEN
jgi:hypothetical protein